MGLQLPREMVKRPPADGEPGSARTFQLKILLVAALTLFCIWQLFGLPGSLLKKVRVPEDMLEFGFGLSSIQLDADGNWIIRRQAYADRMGRYEISPEGELTRSHERGLANEPNRTGSMIQPFMKMEERSFLNVSPSPAYFAQRRALRQKSGTHFPGSGRLEGPDLVAPGTDGARLTPQVVGEAVNDDKYVALDIIRASRWEKAESIPEEARGEVALQYQILAGHNFYAVIDDAAYIAPDLWLTTDKAAYLHHVHASEAGGDISVALRRTIPLAELLPPQTHSVIVGRDPGSGRVYLVTPAGIRLWFDPQTLELLEKEELPGFWAREYGALSFEPRQRLEFPNYNMEAGIPLTEVGYERIQRGMVIVMLGGLLVLLCLWRTPWKYISEATTAASRSNNKPANT